MDCFRLGANAPHLGSARRGMGSGSGAILSEGVNDSRFFGSPHKHLSPGAGTFVLVGSRSSLQKGSPMQLWESELVYVPNCLHCHGRPRMHRHGACRRTGSDGLPTMLQRYRCPRCLRTCSILKDGMLPYRRVSAEQLQSCLDNPQHSQAKTESHKGNVVAPVPYQQGLAITKRLADQDPSNASWNC